MPNMNTNLSPEELARYSRQIIIPDISYSGQLALKNASALIVGCGGLGSIISMYLAAAGFGRLGIVDFDRLDLSNLHRQVLYKTRDIGKVKVEIAGRYLRELNPECQIDGYEEIFSSKNAEKISAPYQMIIDGTDNIPSRYLLNDVSVLTRKPYIFGSVYRFSGQAGVFDSTKGACYRCAFPNPPHPGSIPPCSVAGVAGVTPGLIGLIQASEAIKLVTGIGSPLISRILFYDGLDNTQYIVQVPKDPRCKICGETAEIKQLIDYEDFCKTTYRNELLGSVADPGKISPAEMKTLLANKSDTRIVDLREPVELRIFSFPGSENVQFQNLSAEMKKWDKSQPIILVCHIGFFSSLAKDLLVEEGFSNVRNLDGGIRAWMREFSPPSAIC